MFGPTAPAAPRRPAPRARAGAGRCAAAGDQAALHPGVAPVDDPGPSRRSAGDSRTCLACRAGQQPGPHHTTPLRFLAAGYADPHTLRRLGRARLVPFLHRHSRGAWNDQHAQALLVAAEHTAALWDDELDFADLADDIAGEARLALAITGEIADLDERITTLVARLDPAGIVASAPGIGPITSAVILGRLGDPTRFTSLAAIRAYSVWGPNTRSRP